MCKGCFLNLPEQNLIYCVFVIRGDKFHPLLSILSVSHTAEGFRPAAVNLENIRRQLPFLSIFLLRPSFDILHRKGPGVQDYVY